MNLTWTQNFKRIEFQPQTINSPVLNVSAVTGPQSCWNFITISSNFRLWRSSLPLCKPIPTTSTAGAWKKKFLSTFNQYLYSKTLQVTCAVQCFQNWRGVWNKAFKWLLMQCQILLVIHNWIQANLEGESGNLSEVT